MLVTVPVVHWTLVSVAACVRRAERQRPLHPLPTSGRSAVRHRLDCDVSFDAALLSNPAPVRRAAALRSCWPKPLGADRVARLSRLHQQGRCHLHESVGTADEAVGHSAEAFQQRLDASVISRRVSHDLDRPLLPPQPWFTPALEGRRRQTLAFEPTLHGDATAQGSVARNR